MFEKSSQTEPNEKGEFNNLRLICLHDKDYICLKRISHLSSRVNWILEQCNEYLAVGVCNPRAGLMTFVGQFRSRSDCTERAV